MEKNIYSKQIFKFLLISNIVIAFGFQGWRTLLNNFAVQVAHINGQQMGMIQSIREIPGFLALLVVYLLLFISEQYIVALSVMITGIGIAATGFFPSYMGIIFTTLIMSFGFHYFQTINQSLTIQSFDRTKAPIIMGKLRSASAATNIFVGIILFILGDLKISYSHLFLCLGGIPILAGIYLLFKRPDTKHLEVQQQKIVIKKKYWLFYVLTLLSGARRQVFVAFAVFLLVEKFHYGIQSIAILFVFNNIVNFFVNKKIGHLVNRVGEQKILIITYSTLFFIFIIYGYTHSIIIVGIMYIIDNILFNSSIAINTFFQKIANKKDIASSMSLGFTLNHITAVIIPALGGLLWGLHYKFVFIGGAMLCIVSIVMCSFINYEIKKSKSV